MWVVMLTRDDVEEGREGVTRHFLVSTNPGAEIDIATSHPETLHQQSIH